MCIRDSLSTEVEPVLVHDHLHVLDPHLPGFLGNVLVDLLAQRMALERHFVHAFHLALELHAEDFARPGWNRVLNAVEPAASTTSHLVWISLGPGYQQR